MGIFDHKPWVTVLTNDDFLVQLRPESTGWVDVRVFRVVGYVQGPDGYVPSSYGADEESTSDLSKATQFARGSCKEDGGWYLRIEFCDNTVRGAAVECGADDLAAVLMAIHEHTPRLAAEWTP